MPHLDCSPGKTDDKMSKAHETIVMKRDDMDLLAGLLILAGILSLAYLAIKWGKDEIRGNCEYQVYADFTNIGGLKVDAPVEIAGVEIGSVKNIYLHNYQARVIMAIDNGVKLPEDCKISVKTTGLLGDPYVAVLPGASNNFIPPGGKIKRASPTFDMEDAISEIAFGKI